MEFDKLENDIDNVNQKLRFLEDNKDYTICIDQTDSIIFYCPSQEERLRIAKDGFYVDGKKVTDDFLVYIAFRKFLQGQGLMP